VISRSGTLTYEVTAQLTEEGIGQSTCMGIGGDPIIGTRHRLALELFENDPDTNCVVLIGEIGGTDEEVAAEYAKTMSKPVVAFIAGATAPPGKRIGHAGAIIGGGKGTAAEKKEALRAAGVAVSDSPADVGKLVKKVLTEKGLL
jgi:succinyl-CoA synthetase alpha subunit